MFINAFIKHIQYSGLWLAMCQINHAQVLDKSGPVDCTQLAMMEIRSHPIECRITACMRFVDKPVSDKSELTVQNIYDL